MPFYKNNNETILNQFLSQKDLYYDEESQKDEILKTEYKLKQTLSINEIELLEKLSIQKIDLFKLESLKLIDYILKNFDSIKNIK